MHNNYISFSYMYVHTHIYSSHTHTHKFVTHSSSSSQFSLHSCIDPVNSNPGSDRTKTPDQDLESNGVTYMYEQNPSEADINRKQVDMTTFKLLATTLTKSLPLNCG